MYIWDSKRFSNKKRQERNDESQEKHCNITKGKQIKKKLCKFPEF